MARRKSTDLDNAMDTVNSLDERERKQNAPPAPTNEKVLVGNVEQFFDRIDVVAIKLNGDLKVGDIIEIGDEEDAVRQRISSMQINREDVGQAGEGDSVGIKLKYKVSVGSGVYRIGSSIDRI